MHKRLGIGLAALFLSVPFAAGGGDTDQKSFQGTWKVVSLVSNGEKDKDIKTFRLIFKGNKFSVSIDGKVEEEGTFKLNAAKNPKHIDIADKDAAKDKDKMVLGIYKIEGDSLTLCLGKEGTGKRPNNFTSEKGSERTVFTLQRVKK